MKSILSLFTFLILCASLTKAQEKSAFQPKPELKVYYGIPTAFGDNMLSKAHEAKSNFGFWTSPFSIYNFKIGVGFDLTKFDVTDHAVAGNMDKADLFSVYGFVGYPLKISEKFEFESRAGIGWNKMRQKTGTERYGNMKGIGFILGGNLEYEISYPFQIFAGFDYSYSKFNVNANQEYQSFFDQSQRFSILAGIKVNFGKKPSAKD